MLAYVALTVCPPCAPGHVHHTEQSGRPAGREREHHAAAERLTDSDRTRAVGIRPSRDDLERAVEIIGLNLEAASQIGILARHVGSATGYAWQAIRLAETASQDHYGEPAAGGKIARLRQHHVGAQGLVLRGFGVLAVRDQPIGRRRPPSRALQPALPAGSAPCRFEPSEMYAPPAIRCPGPQWRKPSPTESARVQSSPPR